MKRFSMLAALLICAATAGAQTRDLGNFPDAPNVREEISRMQAEMRRQMLTPSNSAQSEASPANARTRTVTGMGTGGGWDAGLIFGASGRREAIKNAVTDAYVKCDKLGGQITDNVFGKDIFDKFWSDAPDSSKHVECSGWDVIIAGSESCTAWIKLTCTVE